MVKCNFCEVELKNSELIFTCDHNICNICLSHELLLSKLKGIDDNFSISLKCPCGGRLTLTVEQFYSLMTKPPSYSSTKSCNKHKMPYVTYCSDCNIWLCEECKKDFHNDYFVTHFISSLGPPKTSKCFYHKENVKNLFCQNCNELICEICSYEDAHSNHVSISMDTFYQKKAQLKRGLRFKSYQQLEEFISENEQTILKDLIGRMSSNNKAVNEAIKALEEIKKKHFTNTEILLKNLSTVFKIVKQCYKTYYDELNDQKIVLSSFEFISKMTQELSSLNYQPIVQDELEQVNTILQEILNKNLFSINFSFKRTQIKKKSSISLESVVTSLCSISDNGIACGMQNGNINVLKYRESDNNYGISELIGHTASVNALTYLVSNSQASRLASGSSDNSIRIWSYTRKECLYQFNTLHKGSIWDILELTDGRIVSCSSDDTILIWRIEKTTIPVVIYDNTKFESCLCIVDDDTFASGSGDGTVKLWNNQSALCKWLLIGHKDYISCLTYLSRGLIASGSADNQIIIWNTVEKSKMALCRHQETIQKLVLVNDKHLISCSKDKSMIIWDLNYYKCLKQINEAHSSAIYGLIEIGSIDVVTAANDKAVNIWDCTDLTY